MTDKGNGKIRLAPNARLVVLGNCANCNRLWPECQCGRPNPRPLT